MHESTAKPGPAPDAALASAVARLWPHREHESNALIGLCCLAGLHGWRQLDLTELVPGRQIYFCFWCSKVRIDGTIYEP